MPGEPNRETSKGKKQTSKPTTTHKRNKKQGKVSGWPVRNVSN